MAETQKEVTRKTVEDQLTAESQSRGFIEYPKMLYHPDGTQLTVTNKKDEEAAFRRDFHPSPQDAIDVKQKRDEDEAARLQEANNAAQRKKDEALAAQLQKDADEAAAREAEAAKGRGKK